MVFALLAHQKHMPKEFELFILTLDFHFVQSKVKINESFRLKKGKNIATFKNLHLSRF
jgi:hypothetical protein